MSIISPIPTDTNGNPKQTGSMQSLGKNDFLELLITKLENQDPMKPMEDEDFIAQLAQFSSLEQMNNISDAISKSNEWDFLQMQSINNTMASGLIGKEVMAKYSGMMLDHETNPTINYTTDNFADRINFKITDEENNVVSTFSQNDVLAGVNSYQWDGRDNFGNKLPEAYYNVEATAISPGGEVFKPSLTLKGLVQSISYKDNGAYLRVNGTEIALGDISSVGEEGVFSDPE